MSRPRLAGAFALGFYAGGVALALWLWYAVLRPLDREAAPAPATTPPPPAGG